MDALQEAWGVALGQKLLMQDLQAPFVEGWVVAIQAAVQVEAGDEQQKGQDTCRLWGAAGLMSCTCGAAIWAWQVAQVQSSKTINIWGSIDTGRKSSSGS